MVFEFLASWPIPSNPLILKDAGGRNRTADTRIFSPLLYRLSYPGSRKEKRILPKKKLRTITKIARFLRAEVDFNENSQSLQGRGRIYIKKKVGGFASHLRFIHEVPSPGCELQAGNYWTETEICFGFASAFLGRVTVKTPLFRFAEILPESTEFGS